MTYLLIILKPLHHLINTTNSTNWQNVAKELQQQHRRHHRDSEGQEMGRADNRWRPQRPDGGGISRPGRPLGGGAWAAPRDRRRRRDGGAGSRVQVFAVQLPSEPAETVRYKGAGVGEARFEASEAQSVVVYALPRRTLPSLRARQGPQPLWDLQILTRRCSGLSKVLMFSCHIVCQSNVSLDSSSMIKWKIKYDFSACTFGVKIDITWTSINLVAQLLKNSDFRPSSQQFSPRGDTDTTVFLKFRTKLIKVEVP